MKTHLISILILIGLLTLCVGMAMSYYVLMGVMGTVILVFAYCGVYLIVSRNMINKGVDKN
jgi:membrane-bound ClpP family serine protease